ncbi:MAG: ATP-binding cassette domain-containing protein [Actinophytocola sp.]|uniref:ribosomal protection-like ABC-F family protein n=1 Tax=Actinophytocola sp. TaxID=1872138 RepID=UPI0013271503|nr:ABC-F family ATP-binding cassette domain-containing protein [Actinophytocola sp.]MPZ82821.1 ATP-binding cassette domain-containing protein [Actinophytocola sp.]
MSTQLTLRDVRKSFGDRLLLDDVSLAVRPGERVGVVGENGAGKSTLLRLVAGRDRPDDGEVTVTASSTGYLGQTPELPPERTVADAVDAALADLRAMERRMRALESTLDDRAALAEYGDLLTAFELRDGYQADARVDKAMHALGLAHVDRDRGLGTLSGGEQARLGLACLLAAAPELMLLDEPTNHLDAGALTWLEDRLRAHRGTVVAVSHDRVFLERVATAIVEVDADRRTVARYGDGYAGYLAEKTAARRRWEQAHERWCDEIDQLTVFAATTAHQVAHGREMKDRNKPAYDRDKGRVQSSVSSRVRNAQERLRRLRDEPVPRPPDPLRFTGRLAAGDVRQTAVAMHDVRVGDRLHVGSLTVGGRQRLLVHGPNGAGKTTLLRVLAGTLEPDTGSVRRSGRIGYLAQEIPAHHPKWTLLAAFASGRAGRPEEHAERLLSLGLFRPADLRVPEGALSAGQRRRLSLARLLTGQADVLLLDEPSNHLSLTLVEELEEAIDAFAGALVVVSHDRALRRRFTGTQLELARGRLVA